MMKRMILLAVTLLMALPMPGVLAQDAEQTITSDSQRYALTAPDGWYASTAPALADTQSIFPGESITIADSEASLTPMMELGFDFLETTEFTGAALAAVVWPADLVEIAEFDPATFGRLLAIGIDGEATHEPIEHPVLTGDVTRVDNGTRIMIVAPLVDESANMLLLIGAYETALAADVDATLATLEYTAFDSPVESSELTVPVAFLEDTLAVDVPPGWWVLATPEGQMAAPDFDASFMESFSSRDFSEVSGTIIMVLRQDKSTFPEELYDADGRIQPDVLVEVFDLANLLGMSSTSTDFGEVDLTGEAWTSSSGLEGVQLDMTSAERNLVFRMIVVDNDVDLAVIAAMSSADSWETYEETISAIFDTARRIEE